MTKIFFTSNQQFGRPNAISIYNRPFENVELMNNHLIENWNSVVGSNDIVYVLGNFAWDPNTAEQVISKLNGTLIMVEGEYDQSIVDLKNRKLLPKNSAIIEPIFASHLEQLSISYWPMHEWPGKSIGYYHFHGYPDKAYKTDHTKKIVNVSCDFWGYKPFSLEKFYDLINDINNQK
jgi:calcineurin-like phosphoesterase family protein